MKRVPGLVFALTFSQALLAAAPVARAGGGSVCVQRSLRDAIDFQRSRYSAKFFQPVEVASEPTRRELGILKALSDAGGEGKLVEMRKIRITDDRFLDELYSKLDPKPVHLRQAIREVPEGKGQLESAKRVVLVTRAPTSGKLGRTIAPIFPVLEGQGLYVVIDPKLKFYAGGQVSLSKVNHWQSSGYVTVNPSWGVVLSRHETQHIIDHLLEGDRFLASLPRFSDRFGALIEKARSGAELTRLEKKRIGKLEGYLHMEAEKSANLRGFRALLTRDGFRELVLTPDVATNLGALYNEAAILGLRHALTAAPRIWLDPLNPRNAVFVVKAGAGAYLSYQLIQIGGKWLGTGVQLVRDALPEGEN